MMMSIPRGRYRTTSREAKKRKIVKKSVGFLAKYWPNEDAAPELPLPLMKDVYWVSEDAAKVLND